MTQLVETGKWFLLLTGELTVLFLLISFAVTVLQLWIPEAKVRRWMSRPGAVSPYCVGAGIGALTPFCSCSTIPMVAGLLQSGAAFGPTMAFLVASPLLNPIIFTLLLAVMGVERTLLYAAVAFVGAMVTGAVWSKLGLEADAKRVIVRGGKTDDDTRSLGRRAWENSWGLFVSMLPYLLLGTGIGSVIYGLVPEAWVLTVAGPERVFAIPIAAAVGVPMYIRTETLIPIAGVLLEKGMSSGAVIALIIGGAGASIPEVLMLRGLFRTRLVVCFVISIFLFAVGTGAGYELAGM